MFDWRFNPLLLNDINFRQHADNLITDYLSDNDTSDVSDSSLWEAFKAVMRGHIIAYEARLKKDRQKEMSEIAANLLALERDYQQSPAPFKLNDIMKFKYRYNTILSNQVSTMLLKVKQNHFELADKPDKLLARQLRFIQAKRTIHKIKTKTGSTTTNPREINKCFYQFH